MDLFLDFEATQYSKEIIAIGAVAGKDSNGFYSLVRPHNLKKITKDITNLTGITREMCSEQNVLPFINVFPQFWEWCQMQKSNPNEPFQFFTYGEFDTDLIKAAIPHCLEFKKQLEYILQHTYNLERIARVFLTEDGSTISLKKALFNQTNIDVIQTHNPLQDAQMLKTLYKTFKNITIDEIIQKESFLYLKKIKKDFIRGKRIDKRLERHFFRLSDEEIESTDLKTVINLVGSADLEKIIRYDYLIITGNTYRNKIIFNC